MDVFDEEGPKCLKFEGTLLLFCLLFDCYGSISGRELSFLSDVAHACAVGYHTAPLVAGVRADALALRQCQWGSARSRFKRTVGVRSQLTGNRVRFH